MEWEYPGTDFQLMEPVTLTTCIKNVRSINKIRYRLAIHQISIILKTDSASKEQMYFKIWNTNLQAKLLVHFRTNLYKLVILVQRNDSTPLIIQTT